MCSTDVEHLLHVFFYCAFASLCWQHGGLQFNMWEVDDASIWLLEKLNLESCERFSMIAMTLWGIWFFRNKIVWEDRVVSTKFVMEWSLKQLTDWKKASINKDKPNVSRGAHQRGVGARWTTPESGFLKLNVNASVKLGSSSFSIGMVLGDYRGIFMGGRVMSFGKKVSIFELESRGIAKHCLGS